jgi:enoyl-CoA hydratase/carnithine racemase
MATVDQSCRLIEKAAGKGADLKPMLEAISQALDKENEGLRLAFGTDDFRETLKARAEKRLPAFQAR